MHSNTQSDQPSSPTTESGSSKSSGSPKHKGSAGLRVTSIAFRILVIVLILGAGFGIVKILNASKEQPARTEEAMAPVRVRTLTAQRLTVDRTWDGYGTARSMNDANVVAEVGGRVVFRPESIEAGQAITAGTVLLRLDSGDYENALDAANQAASAIEAQLNGLSVESERVGTQIELANDEIDAAQRDLERTQQAIDAGAGNQGEIDVKVAATRRVQREVELLKERLELIPSRRAQLLAQLAGQRASAATAQENLDRSVIKSPINGVLQSVNARRGDWIALGTPVARVVDLTQLEIPVRLPASAINWIERGDEVQLWEGDPVGEPTKTGIITRIAPEADSSSRTITVFVEVEQRSIGDVLSPGRFVLGRVRSEDDRPQFVVPRRAIQSGRLMIAVPDGNGSATIEVRPIQTGYSTEGIIEQLDPIEDQWTVVSAGLNEGDLIVISLLDQINEGMTVELLSAQPETDPNGDGDSAPDTAEVQP